MLRNVERGCGHLKKGALYLCGELSPGGLVPPIVLFDPPVPFPEPHFRGYAYINGLAWQITRRPLERLPWGPEETAEYLARYHRQVPARAGWDAGEALAGATVDCPDEELFRHIARLGVLDLRWLLEQSPESPSLRESAALQDHFGAHDLLMFVGKQYYPKPDDFVTETVRWGLSKRLPFSTPPKVVPGRTRIFLAHEAARASDDGGTVGGIFGYAYASRVVYTLPDRRADVPKDATEWAAMGLVDLEEVGPELDMNGLEPGEQPDMEPLSFGQRLRARITGARVRGGDEE